jgi:exonuclease III
VLALSEHWLYKDELSFLDRLNENFSVISCSSSDNNISERWKRGQGGVALFLKKTLKVREIQTASDRLASVSFKIANINFVIVAVYLPSRNNDLKEYMCYEY